MYITHECDYAGCENVCAEHLMYVVEDWQGYKWYACPCCADKLDDKTGYCGIACQFGYGCDQSC